MKFLMDDRHEDDAEMMFAPLLDIDLRKTPAYPSALKRMMSLGLSEDEAKEAIDT